MHMYKSHKTLRKDVQDTSESKKNILDFICKNTWEKPDLDAVIYLAHLIFEFGELDQDSVLYEYGYRNNLRTTKKNTAESYCYETAKYVVKQFKANNFDLRKIKSVSPEKYNETYVAKDFLKTYILPSTSGKPWLLLSGSVGLGKTYTSNLIMQYAFTQRKTVGFFSVVTLLDMLKPNSGHSMSELLDFCINCDFLILDDLGKEKSSQWVREKLFRIFNARYSFDRKTVITTNHTLKNLHRSIQEPAIMDRIEDKSTHIKFKHESLRSKVLDFFN